MVGISRGSPGSRLSEWLAHVLEVRFLFFHTVIMVCVLPCNPRAVSCMPRACLAIATLCGCPAGRGDPHRVARGTGPVACRAGLGYGGHYPYLGREDRAGRGSS